MAKPTPKVRRGTYERDGHRCISCARTNALTYQHRQGDGAGGSPVPPSWEHGLTSCWDCNWRYESDMQTEALHRGWKVRRWVSHPERVPVFDAHSGRWFKLHTDGPTREPITADQAHQMFLNVYGEVWPRG